MDRVTFVPWQKDTGRSSRIGSPVAAGYSGTPLPKKLGIKEEHRVWFPGAPDGFERLLGRASRRRRGQGAPAQGRSTSSSSSRRGARSSSGGSARSPRLDPAGGLWIAWPKQASGVETDMAEDVARELGVANGLVDNKVCAIDETWSGLRLVYRLKDRPG